MPDPALTARRREVLAFLRAFRRRHGWLPTRPEGERLLGVARSSYRDLLDALVRDGAVPAPGCSPARCGPSAPVAKPCRHCGRHHGGRAGGLCHKCVAVPELRERYPSRQEAGEGLGLGPLRVPPEPTSALPGSLAKQ